MVAFFQRDYQKRFRNICARLVAIDPVSGEIASSSGNLRKKIGRSVRPRFVGKAPFLSLKDKSLRLQVGLELASLYEQQGDPGATASVMRSLVDLDPDNVDVLFMAQRVYSELADDTLNKLAVLAPGSARMQQVIAEHLVNGGDLPRAIEHYKKAFQIDPHLPGVHFELGEAILQSSPHDSETQMEAEKEFEAAEAIDGDVAKAECGLGAIALSQIGPGSRVYPLPASLQT